MFTEAIAETNTKKERRRKPDSFMYYVLYYKQKGGRISKNRMLPIRVDESLFEMVQRSAKHQKISQAEVVRQSLFFGLSESSYYRTLEIAKKEGVHPASIIQQAFSLTDALMNPSLSVSDVLVDANPGISFADAMKSLGDLQAVLIAKIETKKGG